MKISKTKLFNLILTVLEAAVIIIFIYVLLFLVAILSNPFN